MTDKEPANPKTIKILIKCDNDLARNISTNFFNNLSSCIFL